MPSKLQKNIFYFLKWLKNGSNSITFDIYLCHDSNRKYKILGRKNPMEMAKSKFKKTTI